MFYKKQLEFHQNYKTHNKYGIKLFTVTRGSNEAGTKV